jgi:MscS family membrane protein
MKFITLLVLFFTILFSADINQSLIKEQNLTIFNNLLKDLNQSDPNYQLNRTLILKTKQILSKDDKLKIDFDIKNQQDFIEAFYKINRYLVTKYRLKDENNDLKEQLEDIKDDISNLDKNSSNYLTLNLEYAYYYHQIEKNSKIAKTIEEQYKQWLDKLLTYLPKIKFSPDKKKLEKLKKNLQYYEKRLKKFSVELERYKILQRDDLVKKAEENIAYLTKKKEKIVSSIIKEELKEFFLQLQKKSEKSIKKSKEIINFAKEKSDERYLSKALEVTLNYSITKILGARFTYFLLLKQQILDFLNNNEIIGVPLYKFAQALGIFLLFLILRKIFALIILSFLKQLTKATKTSFDDKILKLIEGPVKFSFIIIGLYFAFKVSGIDNEVTHKIIKSLIIFVIFWLFYNFVNILDESIYRFTRKFGKELYREIGNFFIKTLKIFIFSVGLVSILQVWDINVSAFIASLGLGGLAFALAAKDTAANLFGGLSILVDRSLKIDDWIKVGNVEGVVEDIGLRTTKVRTFEKSLITVPNQYIANNPIENFSRRDIRRIKMRIGLVYSTSKEQVRAIVEDIKNMLKSHKGIAQHATMLVNFDEFGSSELSIFIYCFTNTANWAKYLEIKEDINLKIMDIVKAHGSDFAFPSESIYIEKLPEGI